MTVSDLKTKGISDIERALQDAQEVVISVWGKPRNVLMDLVRYDFLRECEIAAAWAQTRGGGCRPLSGEGRRCAFGKASMTSSPMRYSLILARSHEMFEMYW